MKRCPITVVPKGLLPIPVNHHITMEGQQESHPFNSTSTTATILSPRSVEVAVVMIVAMGIIINAWSAYYVAKTFPFRKIAIFFFSLVDSAVCLAGSSLHLVTYIASKYRKNLVVCVLQSFAMYFQVVSGVLITLLIAVTRWEQVSERKAFRAGILVYCANMVGFAYKLLWRPFFERSLLLVNLCVGYDGPLPRQLGWEVHLTNAWMVLVLLVPVLANGVTMILIKIRSMAPVKPTSTYTIPLKATLLSAVLFATYLIVAVLTRQNLGRTASNDIETVGAAVINTVRCPLTMALSFSAKVRADHESRKARQNQVREWAKKEREKTKSNSDTSVA